MTVISAWVEWPCLWLSQIYWQISIKSVHYMQIQMKILFLCLFKTLLVSCITDQKRKQFPRELERLPISGWMGQSSKILTSCMWSAPYIVPESTMFMNWTIKKELPSESLNSLVMQTVLVCDKYFQPLDIFSTSQSYCHRRNHNASEL